jgi:hypothetical protein
MLSVEQLKPLELLYTELIAKLQALINSLSPER